MTDPRVVQLLTAVAAGEVSPARAMERLPDLLVDDLGYANVDHARPMLQGVPEVLYGEGKTVEQIMGICQSMVRASGGFLVTRAPDACLPELEREFPGVRIDRVARTAWLATDRPPTGKGTVLVVSAGTSDEPVAREAAVTAEALGNRVERLADVGVAGIHRLLRHRERVNAAAVVIVVAGMDGALASVVGGMVSAPVIAVPTSVGYGTAFGGVSALLAMLNSCASGVSVVNIDAGFSAGAAAARINRAIE